MKVLLILLLLPVFTIAQDSSAAQKPKMKQYFFVMLKAGPNRSQDLLPLPKNPGRAYGQYQEAR